MNILDLINKKEWKKLIKNTKDINQPIWNDNGLIHYAGLQNNIDLLSTLIENGAKLNLTNGNGESIAHIAAKNGYTELLKKILKENPKLLYNKDNSFNTPLHYLMNDTEIVKYIFNNYKSLDWKYLLNQVNKDGKTPIIEALVNGNYIISKLLFEKENVNFKKPFENIPLIVLISSLQFTTQEKKELITSYLNNKGDINAVDNEGYNGLFSTIALNDYELLKFLDKAGIDLDYMSPISTIHTLREAYAYGILNNDFKIINYILKQNITYNKSDKHNDSLGHYVLLHRKFRKLGDIDIEKKILEKTKNFNIKNIDGNTILHLICYLGWKDYKELLVNHSNILDIYSKNKDGETPLDFINKKDKDKFFKIIAKNFKNNKKDKRETTEIVNLIKKRKINFNELERDIEKINLMNNYKFAIYSKFSASLLDVIIYSIFLLEKYNNILTAPIELKKFEQLLDLQISSEIHIQSNPFYSSDIFHFIIFWENKNKYFISKKLMLILKKLIKNNKYRFIFLYLSIGSQNTLHANVILIDIKSKTIERFDPYGDIETDIDIVLKDYFKVIPKFVYLSAGNYMGTSSFQTLSNETDVRKKKVGDLGGFCLAWCIWYIELRINNNLKPKILVEKTIKKMIRENKIFIDFIRNYGNHLAKFSKIFYLDSGIDKKNIYNKVHKDEDIIKIKKNILKKISKFKHP